LDIEPLKRQLGSCFLIVMMLITPPIAPETLNLESEPP
jgi:hypothetical protein